MNSKTKNGLGSCDQLDEKIERKRLCVYIIYNE